METLDSDRRTVLSAPRLASAWIECPVPVYCLGAALGITIATALLLAVGAAI